jgi:hypothetical protein
MVRVLGIDPDSRVTAWAIASDLEIFEVGKIVAKTGVMFRLTGIALEQLLKSPIDLVVIEGQEIYPGQPASPNDILTLCRVAFTMVGQVSVLAPTVKLAFPAPKVWKKQVPKEIHQARIFSHYGVLYSTAAGYAYPSGCAKAAQIKGAGSLNRGDWKHVSDAIGLALWGATLLKNEQ